MASKQHLQERIDKWNIKIDGYNEKIAKYEERLAKALKLLSKNVGEEVTVDTYEQYGRIDFDNYMRVSNALDGIETNKRNIRWATREIDDIQYKLDAILQKEREFDSDLENILQDKLKEFKEQWIDRMNTYYATVWSNIRKKAPKAKALYDQYREEYNNLPLHQLNYRVSAEYNAKMTDCKKIFLHESMKYKTANEYVNSKYDDIVNYFNTSVKRLVEKCYKFNINRNNIKVSYPEVTDHGMECFINDGSKTIWARMIWAAEYSDYMVPHVRYIVTEHKNKK